MKFNEKLIKLRKEKALTQEELAEQLGVTRQTISKWELGQTDPDKDSLMEMSRLFNVSVDELLNESETIKDTASSNDMKNKSDETKKIILIVVIAVLILGIIGWVIFASLLNMGKNLISYTLENSTDIISSVTDRGTDILGNIIEKGNEFANQIDSASTDSNSAYETSYSGVIANFRVKNAINEVITDNMKNENKIVVVYNDITAVKSEELADLMGKLDKQQYLVTYDYDNNGKIYRMNIKDVESQNSNNEKIQEMQEQFNEIKNMVLGN